MANTIRHRILDLLTKRLRNALVHECLVSPPDGSVETVELMKPVSVAGTYSGTYPRSFVVAVSAPNTVTITENTLWASLGRDHPANFTSTQSYVSGTPFQISTTGISVTITHSVTDPEGLPITLTPASLVGKSWDARCSKAYETVTSIEIYRTEWNDEPYPLLSVFPSKEIPSTNETLDNSTKSIKINLVLIVDATSRDVGRIEEVLGDIENEMLRDVYFYDNTDCLSIDCKFIDGDMLDANTSAIGMLLTFEITYRNKLNDTRTK